MERRVSVHLEVDSVMAVPSTDRQPTFVANVNPDNLSPIVWWPI